MEPDSLLSPPCASEHVANQITERAVSLTSQENLRGCDDVAVEEKLVLFFVSPEGFTTMQLLEIDQFWLDIRKTSC